jgi:PIN domain nuclease of toxin-antitoxin system
MSGFLLDSHVIIRLVEGVRLSTQARRRIERALHQNAVFISAVSAWEIVQLSVRGRVPIRASSHDWLQRIVDASGFVVLPLTADCAIDAALLPPIHRDPADRFLIATARIHDLTLATSDTDILEYAEAGVVRVLEC